MSWSKNGGKIVVVLLALSAAAAGAGIWYTQQRAFFEDAPSLDQITLTTLQLEEQSLPVSNHRAIVSVSSPLGYRACFTLDEAPLGFTEIYERPPSASPTVAPGWFDCFDAQQLGEDLQDRRAIALLGQKNIAYGVDRLIALFPDGSGFAWHQLNNCGQKAYDGTVVGEECPPAP